MTPQWPILTWSNLEYLWELEVCWAGKGGVGVGQWHESHMSDQDSQAISTHPVQQRSSFSWRSSVNGAWQPPSSPPVRQLHSRKSSGRGSTPPLKLYFWNWKTEKFKTLFHFQIAVQLRIRSLSYLLRLNPSCSRGIHFSFQHCSLWVAKRVQLLNRKDRKYLCPPKCSGFLPWCERGEEKDNVVELS